MAIEVLKSRGVPEEHILFLNLIASPEGAQNLAEKFPKVRVVTAFVDEGLDEKKYVVKIFLFVLVLTEILATSFLGWVTLATVSTRCKGPGDSSQGLGEHLEGADWLRIVLANVSMRGCEWTASGRNHVYMKMTDMTKVRLNQHSTTHTVHQPDA
jgi:hypothetical protein